MKRIAFTGFVLFVVFAAGVLTAIQRGWGSKLVEVSVENRTSAQVHLVKLSYASCGATGLLQLQELASGTNHVFKFLVCGEGGYVVEATLSDGRILKSGAYVESGYATIEQIDATQIQSKYRSF
jgi:hypothetical protein